MLLKLQFYYFVQYWLFNDFNPTAMKWKVSIRFFFKFWWGSVGESSSTPPIAPYRDFNKLAKIESDIAYQSIFYWRFWRQCMLRGASDTSVFKILRLCGTILLCLGHKSREKTLSVIVERTLNSEFEVFLKIPFIVQLSPVIPDWQGWVPLQIQLAKLLSLLIINP